MDTSKEKVAVEESGPTAVTMGTLEALQNQAAQFRRARPPDLDEANADENRVPLKPEKLSRRESRVGLRSIFGGRSKATKEAEFSNIPKELTRPGGIRASLAEISNWPYGLHGARSELTLSTVVPPMSDRVGPAKSSTTPAAENHKKSSSGGKSKSATAPKSTRGALATWDPPPLFQAYPQAIKHAQLPACTLSAEAIVRLNGGRGSNSLREDLTQTPIGTELSEEAAANGDKSAEKARKKHRRNTSGSSFKVDWTTKIYVLVTSGYLLQYGGEGSFDRLPEKMLHLGKDSAAFASDMIPGRHWVLQVSSTAESDSNGPADSRSLFSRLPFRGPEKRSTSTFLMVFEAAEEMDMWIATLRREIEALGGKKSLSETGRPKADEHVVQLRTQPSQRTLVVRDPDRFSRAGAGTGAGTGAGAGTDLGWNHDDSFLDGSDSTLNEPADAPADQAPDDVSTTTSVVSHDGRQLESLRDSAHRLSYISSGQRTIITSEGSSPACSPTRDSFQSQVDDASGGATRRDSLSDVARPRPNAAAISERRKSMQAMNSMFDFRLAGPAATTAATTSARPHSTAFHEPPAVHALACAVPISVAAVGAVPSSMPNFSVPLSKRYSLMRSPPPELTSFASASALPVAVTSPVLASQAAMMRGRDPSLRGARRPPPTSLALSRPLSTVADQPSPGQTSPPPQQQQRDSYIGSGAQYHHVRSSSSSSTAAVAAESTPPSMFTTWVHDTPVTAHTEAGFEDLAPQPPLSAASADVAAARGGGFDDKDTTIHLTIRASPRKYASMQTLRTSDHFDDPEEEDDDEADHVPRQPPAEATVILSPALTAEPEVEEEREEDVYSAARGPVTHDDDDDDDDDDDFALPAPSPAAMATTGPLRPAVVLDLPAEAFSSPTPPLRSSSPHRNRHKQNHSHDVESSHYYNHHHLNADKPRARSSLDIYCPPRSRSPLPPSLRRDAHRRQSLQTGFGAGSTPRPTLAAAAAAGSLSASSSPNLSAAASPRLHGRSHHHQHPSDSSFFDFSGAVDSAQPPPPPPPPPQLPFPTAPLPPLPTPGVASSSSSHQYHHHHHSALSQPSSPRFGLGLGLSSVGPSSGGFGSISHMVSSGNLRPQSRGRSGSSPGLLANRRSMPLLADGPPPAPPPTCALPPIPPRQAQVQTAVSTGSHVQREAKRGTAWKSAIQV